MPEVSSTYTAGPASPADGIDQSELLGVEVQGSQPL